MSSESVDASQHPARSIAGWVLAAAALLLILIAAQPVGLDLKVYREGALTLLANPAELYAPILGAVGDPGLPFTYPPVAAILFVPFALLPFPAAYLMLTAVSFALTHLVVCDLVSRYRWLGRYSQFGWALTPVVMLTAPFLDTFTYGQINIVLLAACYFALAKAKNEWLFGLAVGLTASIKLTPLALLLLPLVLWRWRTILVAGAAFAIPQLVTLLLLPEATISYWGRTIWDPARVGEVAYIDNLSLRGIFERAGAPGWVWLLGVAVVIMLSGAAIGRRRVWDPTTLLGFASGCMLLISPISWVHHFVWWPLILGAWLARDVRTPLATPQRICSALLFVSLLINPKILARYLATPTDSAIAQLLAAAPGAVIIAGTIVVAFKPQMTGRTTSGQTALATRNELDPGQ